MKSMAGSTQREALSGVRAKQLFRGFTGIGATCIFGAKDAIGGRRFRATIESVSQHLLLRFQLSLDFCPTVYNFLP